MSSWQIVQYITGCTADRLLDQRKHVLRRFIRGFSVPELDRRSVEQAENRHLLAKGFEHDRHLLGDGATSERASLDLAAGTTVACD
ncbi:hypothetical protein FFT09_13760 [Saccharomonospora piscinae]|uniref:hypothetical protein n=1 Tax=Saccharomonospora piscinae TaxID=687388 RepID=UPI00110666DB|nr:hypothetical protein [Saccharomonospora piscinae]TLW91963.1 hypothetical protein FFT09_13760 [Saccharomonospora piscinae]